MPTIDRQDAVLNILQNLRDLDGLKKLFWQELNYERENRPLSPRQWPESARQPLAEDPILFATGGEDNAFHVVYCRLESDALLRGHERPVVNRLTREHPYALFVFSNKGRTDWYFLNVKYDEEADKRRLLRRITVRPGEGLRTAAERMQMLDLETISPDLFALSPLTIQQRHDDAFDVEKVSKDFYREIANWYFWALKHVTFPKDAPKEQDGRDHISVIRLITRLIFCWFIREKGLIPGVLFDEPRLAEMLDGFAPGKKRNKDSVFYRAIVQNLFFATLNTEMDQRGWRRADQNFMAHSLYRHKECFRDPKAGLEWFKDIPFLNGGLFECLDRDFGLPAEAPASAAGATAGKLAKAGEGAKPRYLRVDGFSDRDDSRPTVPDFLFFGSEQDVDLSEDYGDKKFRSVRVRGLIDTLNRYKFTIEENTPFDQEVALDPELCGKVFENLLAAYNPETGTTARKATGSFYTPREIVDYMVDESLVAYLKGKLTGKAAKDPDKALRALLAYDGEPHGFDEKATGELIDAIDGLKALDPAVGSGAFPMGILHKLVLVLGKLDPDNERWKAKQIAKLDDATMREDAERLFRENYDDYGRKLYLIENCIYGVDIQPIAVQIAKMRFFISLVVDQKVNPKAPNLGVRALPNLETKFVAANTLIGIDRPAQMMLRNPDIDKKEAELRKVREQHFTARTLKSKAKCRDEDKRLRAEIAELLKNDGWDNSTARQLAAWDPYDQNTHADFFDSEWMFGVMEGFDVVIGNPPYGIRYHAGAAELGFPGAENARKVPDSYILFILRSFNLLDTGGILSFIVPNTFCDLENADVFRRHLLTSVYLWQIWQTGWAFDSSIVDTLAFFLSKATPAPDSAIRVRIHDQVYSRSAISFLENDLSKMDYRNTAVDGDLLAKIAGSGPFLGTISCVKAGVKLYERGKGSPPQDEAIIRERPYTTKGVPPAGWRPLIRGTHVDRYRLMDSDEYVSYGEWLAAPRSPELFESPKILMRRTDDVLRATLEQDGAIAVNSCHVIKLLSHEVARVSYSYVLGCLNSRLLQYYFEKCNPQMVGKTFAEIKVVYVERLPIAHASDTHGTQIERLVSRILAAKKADPAADTSALEREIDERVYKLYGLTAAEIKIVESASARDELRRDKGGGK